MDNIIQTFYDNMASHYDKLFMEWDATVKEQAMLKLFKDTVTASDISDAELNEADLRAQKAGVNIGLKNEYFRALAKTHEQKFDIIISMDNALLICSQNLTSKEHAEALQISSFRAVCLWQASGIMMLCSPQSLLILRHTYTKQSMVRECAFRPGTGTNTPTL